MDWFIALPHLSALAKRLPPASFLRDLDDESATEMMAEFWSFDFVEKRIEFV
uniref:Uncharacterized protein n=1 Tax=Romanomermis culicivorax TaxID=13658 RepID=A0A915JYK5_ROMCU